MFTAYYALRKFVNLSRAGKDAAYLIKSILGTSTDGEGKRKREMQVTEPIFMPKLNCYNLPQSILSPHFLIVSQCHNPSSYCCSFYAYHLNHLQFYMYIAVDFL